MRRKISWDGNFFVSFWFVGEFCTSILLLSHQGRSPPLHISHNSNKKRAFPSLFNPCIEYGGRIVSLPGSFSHSIQLLYSIPNRGNRDMSTTKRFTGCAQPYSKRVPEQERRMVFKDTMYHVASSSLPL